jgi:hypothetical protein
MGCCGYGVGVVRGVSLLLSGLSWVRLLVKLEGVPCGGRKGMPLGSVGVCRRAQRVRLGAIAMGGICTMSVLRHCNCQRSGGVPMMSQRRMAWCSVSIWWRVMLFVAMRSGRLLPRVRCSSVSIAIVPHDQEGAGASFCMAMRLTLR